MQSVCVKKSPGLPEDTLRRVFFMHAFKIENQDAFLDALYGQNVGDEPHWDMTREPSAALLTRVRHAIGITLNEMRVKELVVALEWSKNDPVLEEILKWAEKAGNKDLADTIGSVSIDLAPQRVLKTFASMLSSTAVSQRSREVSWESESKLRRINCLRFEVCRNCNNIIVGFGTGDIKIYNSLDLQCEAMFSYFNNSSEVYCLQCTCAEIIAGYKDGSIWAWELKSGILKQRIFVRSASGDCWPYRLRWKNPKLMVVIWNLHFDRIQTWQYVNSSFMLLGDWSTISRKAPVKHIEFDENYVILQDDVLQWDYSASSLCIHAYFPYGQLQRTIEDNAIAMAYQNGKLITGGLDKILRIWDVDTGACLRELQGHDDEINYVQLHNNTLLSASHLTGVMTIWDLAKILERSADEPESSSSASAVPLYSRKLVVTKNNNDYEHILFGRSYILGWEGSRASKFRLIDFV